MQKNNYPQIGISENKAAALAIKYYGLKTQVKRLLGEADFNFYLKTEDGKEYTLKISYPDANRQTIDLQAKIMCHLVASKLPFHFPAVVPSIDGREYIDLEDGRFLRLQKWVPGRMLAEVTPRSNQLLENWGKIAGSLSLHLAGFDHPAAHRSYKWNPSQTLEAKKYRSFLTGNGAHEIADYFWNLFATTALPHLPVLRKSVNHNDAHGLNLLASFDLKNPTITGVIDFGDALYTETINELAIACAYASMHLPDPMQALANVVRGYHEVYPLEEKELAILFPLIGARLTLSVCYSAWNKHHEPDNEYLIISEKPAWGLLKKLRHISPALAHYTFRHACGLEPHPNSELFGTWAASKELAPVIDFDGKTTTPLDFSVGSISNFENVNNFQKSISKLLKDKEADIGIGGYREVRPFYTADAYKIIGNSGAQWRTVHLGIDVWTEAETPVFAPLEGTVHSFQNNLGDGNYGPTIILEHKVDCSNFAIGPSANNNKYSLTFYTLYGHLSMESIDGIEKGMPIQKGQRIANVGAAPINGNWPPHLHFQVILDILGNKGDFPGVAFPEESETWLSICPDGRFFV